MARAGLDKDPRDVADMFDGVARRYDLTNAVLAMGQDRRWRVHTTRSLDLKPGERVLDLAAGTGTSTADLASTGAWCVAADFSLGMLRLAQQRGLPLVAADGLRLPFADGVFDAVTVSFGLRNMADASLALRELARVTRSGGRLVLCEFSRPAFAPLRWGYSVYLKLLPAIARKVSSNASAYEYLAESIAAWPDQRALAELIANSGWEDIAWRNLTGGVVALHRAFKP